MNSNNPLTKTNKHIISRYNVSGELLETYLNARVAAEAMGGSQQVITVASRGTSKLYTAYGYIWRRGNDPQIDLKPLLKQKWYGSSPLAKKQFTVGQYDMDGNLVNTYLHAKDAAKAIGVHYNGIRDVIKGRGLTYGGFVWSKVIKKKITVNPQIKLNSRVISQYDLNGRWLRSFKSGLEACRETGIGNDNISLAIKGTTITAGGYLWRKGQQLRINTSELRHHPKFATSLLEQHMKAKRQSTIQQ